MKQKFFILCLKEYTYEGDEGISRFIQKLVIDDLFSNFCEVMNTNAGEEHFKSIVDGFRTFINLKIDD